MPTPIPLTLLPQSLAQAGFTPPGYRVCYEAARSAHIPATRENNGRWVFNASDVGTIAERMRELGKIPASRISPSHAA
jgi:predicted site-specific integrase-resolvase